MATELADGLWWFDLGRVNAFLADDDGDLTLVDAGTPFDSGDIARGVNEAGYSVNDIDRVLVTHYDFDHVGALSRLASEAPVFVGKADAPILSGTETPDWQNHKGAFQRAAGSLVSAPENDIRPVEDENEIGSFTAYTTPGHSPGHVVYVSEKLDAAFFGDLVMESHGKLKPSSWAMSYDTDDVRDSIVSLAERAPDFEVAGMGHGVPFIRDGSERLRELAKML
ncbi:MBL fold metallo-hydrolase [Haladaptatus cibarius]|uniref:MBL fold metallo-hydrolase n=1 Tax=Haladaptatus cibarius TaxID=453847 RepID=UPI000679AE29|nr:MBL fold metallo-hydrolase [Haladaptatus cibarius]